MAGSPAKCSCLWRGMEECNLLYFASECAQSFLRQDCCFLPQIHDPCSHWKIYKLWLAKGWKSSFATSLTTPVTNLETVVFSQSFFDFFLQADNLISPFFLGSPNVCRVSRLKMFTWASRINIASSPRRATGFLGHSFAFSCFRTVVVMDQLLKWEIWCKKKLRIAYINYQI